MPARRSYRHALLLGLVLALPITAHAERSSPTPAPAAPEISQAEALAAWDRYRADPLNRLDVAPIFLKFMQAGAVHTVLRSDVLFWMYKAYPQDLQAVLYAAYMGGNMDAQLRGARRGDDPEAGITAALDAWKLLKPRFPKLSMRQLDEWESARQAGKLAAALATLDAPANP
jgi:hypothetical protein